MICVKFDQKIKKKLKKRKFGLFRFLGFLKNLKNLGFFGAIFQPCSDRWNQSRMVVSMALDGIGPECGTSCARILPVRYVRLLCLLLSLATSSDIHVRALEDDFDVNE